MAQADKIIEKIKAKPSPNNMISLHRPHPGNEVKPCYIKDVRETLEEIGRIEARK